MLAAAFSTCPLTDLPQELLRQCMPGHESLPQVWPACRKLFNACLDHLRLCLAAEQDVDTKRAILLRLVPSFHALKMLRLHFGKELTSEVLTNVPSPWPRADPSVLAGIVDMTVTATTQDVDAHAHLNSLIPQCIITACPQLRKLTLSKITLVQHQIQPSSPSQQQPVMALHLQQLVLDQCIIDMTYEAVEQQLQVAPSLQHLKLVTMDLETLNRVGSKVSELQWLGTTWKPDKRMWAFSDVQQPCLMLSKLVAHNLIINDGLIEKLLDVAPNLEHLDVRTVRIMNDWSKELQCKWQQVHFQAMPDYATLAYLPVTSAGAMQLFCHSTAVRITVTTSNWSACSPQDDYWYPRGILTHDRFGNTVIRTRPPQEWGPEWDLQVAVRAQAVAQRGGGIHCQGAKATFTIQEDEPPAMQQVLMHLVCMFNNLKHIVLTGNIHVSTALLTIVGELPSCKHLELADKEGFHVGGVTTVTTYSCQDGIWGGMVSLLPHVTKLTLRLSQVTAHDVQCLCAAATHAIHVQVMRNAWCMDTDTLCAVGATACNRRVLLEVLS